MRKNALITGVAGGIGHATALLFHKSGWNVIGVDKQTPKGLNKKIRFIKGDVSEPISSKRIFREVSKVYNGLDALINNAALLNCKSIQELKPDEWTQVMASNVGSIYLSTKNALRLLLRTKGAIVNVSSVHAMATSAHISAYAASKGAVVSLTRALAVELAGDGIRVNTVLPGAVDTQMFRLGSSRGGLKGASIDQKIKNLSQKTLLGRIGKPEEIAQSIFFLANGESSSFITGQTLVVDGGALARLSTE